MTPASGPSPSVEDVNALVAPFFEDDAPDLGTPPGGPTPTEPLVRGALAILSTTLAAPLVAAFPSHTAAIRLIMGSPASPGRVIGPGADDADQRLRSVNDRYRAEHPALIASSLAHALLWSPEIATHPGETLLHALNAMVHVQLVAREPALAHLGTELCRRQNSLAITLCNSRRPGSPRIRLVAPDGPGTLPGGDPALQSPDFWSVPFGPPGDADMSEPTRAVAADVFTPLMPANAPTFECTELWGRSFGVEMNQSWLSPVEQLRVSLALGLVRPETVESAFGSAEVLSDPLLIDAVAPWDD